MLLTDEQTVPGAVLDLCERGAVHVIDSAHTAPGACFLTNTSVGPFIDTFLDIDELPVHGRVFLATSLIESLAGMLGWAPKHEERLAELEAQNRNLRDELDGKDAVIDDLRKTVASMRDAGYESRRKEKV